jgi:hypothetical protein
MQEIYHDDNKKYYAEILMYRRVAVAVELSILLAPFGPT